MASSSRALLDLPDELLAAVVDRCDGRARRRLVVVCRRLYAVGVGVDRRRTHLNVQKEYELREFVCADAMIDYMENRFPRLTSISLKGTPVVLSARHLRKLFVIYPQLHTLDLSQQFTFPRLHPHTLPALEFGSNLRHLDLSHTPLRVEYGAHKRFVQIPPPIVWSRLTTLKMHCTSGLVLRALSVLRDCDASIALQHVMLGGRTWITLNRLELSVILWLLKACRHSLLTINLCDLCVTDDAAAIKLMNSVLKSPKLQKLSMHAMRIRLDSENDGDGDVEMPMIESDGLRNIVASHSDEFYYSLLRNAVAQRENLTAYFVHPDAFRAMLK